jgi:hypothetical protein
MNNKWRRCAVSEYAQQVRPPGAAPAPAFDHLRSEI